MRVTGSPHALASPSIGLRFQIGGTRNTLALPLLKADNAMSRPLRSRTWVHTCCLLACLALTSELCTANPFVLGSRDKQSPSRPVGNASANTRGTLNANNANRTPSARTAELRDGEQRSGVAASTSTDDAASGDAFHSNEGEQDPEPIGAGELALAQRPLPANDGEQDLEPVADIDLESTEPAATPPSLDIALGMAWWFVQKKAIFGPSIRIGGRWVWVAAETNLVTRYTPSFGHRLLGASFGTYLELSPLRTRQLEAHLGLGSDYHWLAAINSEEWKFAFAARASLHGWLGKHVGVFVAGRGYLAKSKGLGLGLRDSGVSQFPLLFSAGVEWRP